MMATPDAPALVLEALRLLGPGDPERLRGLRVGIDLVDLDAFARLLGSPAGSAFVSRSFDPSEIDYCGGNLQRLGGRWAAKEAVAKAIGTGFRDGLNALDIVIEHHSQGAPVVTARPGARWPEQADRWEWALSLAHERHAAIAIAIARDGTGTFG